MRERGIGQRWMLEALIFVTGGVVLAFELLASRIMSPYFGVSLYIWTAILSTTLVSLALGYAWGGRLSRNDDRDQLLYGFLISPSLASLAIVSASAMYPFLFPRLLDLGLVGASLLASVFLLGPALLLLAAMNPLLMAIVADTGEAAGRPAGRVLCISTIGSVAGVFLTTFVLIPRMTNFISLLVLAIALGLLTIVVTRLSPSLSPAQRRRLYAVSLLACVTGSTLLVTRDAYLTRITVDDDAPIEARIVAEYASHYGNVKVVEIRPQGADWEPFLAYLQDGLLQNRANLDGSSISPYTYVLEFLTTAYAPDAKRVLVLGLGAGIVPRNLAARGLDVSVVEINRDALAAASGYFRLDPSVIDIQWEDARTFVRRCRSRFDVVVVDLFQGDYAPEHLISQEFFLDVARCMKPVSVAVMNAIFDESSALTNLTLLATVRAAFPRVAYYESETGGNSYLVASAQPITPIDTFYAPVPPEYQSWVAPILSIGAIVTDQLIQSIEPLTDAGNKFPVLFANVQMQHRRRIVRWVPPRLLVN